MKFTSEVYSRHIVVQESSASRLTCMHAQDVQDTRAFYENKALQNAFICAHWFVFCYETKWAALSEYIPWSSKAWWLNSWAMLVVRARIWSTMQRTGCYCGRLAHFVSVVIDKYNRYIYTHSMVATRYPAPLAWRWWTSLKTTIWEIMRRSSVISWWRNYSRWRRSTRQSGMSGKSSQSWMGCHRNIDVLKEVCWNRNILALDW